MYDLKWNKLIYFMRFMSAQYSWTLQQTRNSLLGQPWHSVLWSLWHVMLTRSGEKENTCIKCQLCHSSSALNRWNINNRFTISPKTPSQLGTIAFCSRDDFSSTMNLGSPYNDCSIRTFHKECCDVAGIIEHHIYSTFMSMSDTEHYIHEWHEYNP